MKFLAAVLALFVMSSARAAEIGRLDHVFLILMENRTDTDIIPNPDAPFINGFAKTVNRAENYYAVGHPSAPNYLEIVGGSNFGLTNDFWPDWLGTGCVDNAPGSKGCQHSFAPIAGSGTDNAVVATATDETQCNGEVQPQGHPVPRNCALRDYPATAYTGQSIADQLVKTKRSWKSYQENLPSGSPAGINYADGTWSNLSPPEVFAPGPIQKLYAVKHNPFAYFRAVQEGRDPALSLDRATDFNGLWADLATGRMPNFALIVPDQCHDMHGGVEGGTPICSSKTQDETRLLIRQGDAAVARIVAAIEASPAWKKGRNVIILVWDENDYDNAANKVVMLVETSYGRNGRVSTREYDHYSLLRTFEEGFGLPCLNHACDATSHVMDDLFGG